MSQKLQNEIRQAFNAIEGIEIPDLPQEVIALDIEMGARYPNTKNMADIISGNTKLTAKLLKLANSPVMRAKSPIKNIQEAISVLGMQNMRNQFISVALMDAFSSNNQLIRGIMDNSREVAWVCAELSRSVQGVDCQIDADEAFLAGLFHNCGSLLLSMKNSNRYQKVYEKSKTHPWTVLEVEQVAFGAKHTAAGVILANNWKLPTHIQQVIYEHHNHQMDQITNEKTRLLVAMIALADYIVSELSLGAYIGEEMKSYAKLANQVLLIDDSELTQIRRAFQTQSAKGGFCV